MHRKKVIIISLLMIFSILLAGCVEGIGDDTGDFVSTSNGAGYVHAGDLENGKRWFDAKVVEVSTESLTVMPLGDSFETSAALDAGLIVHFQAEVKSGDHVRITYNGMIAESYPSQIFNVYSIEVIDQDDYIVESSSVYLTTHLLVLDGNYPSIEVIWHNDSDKDITYGAWYTVEYLQDGEWTDTAIGDVAYDEIAYVILAGGTSFRSYPFRYSYSIEKPGTYRMRTEYFYPTENASERRSIWIEFEVPEN